MAAVAEHVTTQIKKTDDYQLAQQRRKIYQSRLTAYNLLRGETGKVLTPAAPSVRKPNFEQFVSLYFYNLDHAGNTHPFSDYYGQPTKLSRDSGGYKTFEKFAMTDYGSYVVKTMLDNPSKYKGFKVWENAFGGAYGDYHFISLPKGFGLQERRFATSKQRIHFLGILYHEFAHTMVFRPLSSKGIDITIYDEREAVLRFENPIRIRDNYEPRYTYTKRDGSETINIITRTVKPGKWTVRKDDPTVLVKAEDKDALA